VEIVQAVEFHSFALGAVGDIEILTDFVVAVVLKGFELFYMFYE